MFLTKCGSILKSKTVFYLSLFLLLRSVDKQKREGGDGVEWATLWGVHNGRKGAPLF